MTELELLNIQVAGWLRTAERFNDRMYDGPFDHKAWKAYIRCLTHAQRLLDTYAQAHD